MLEGARAAMLLLKLDIISFLNYAWREVHNKMLLRRSIALDCLERTLPPIDQDQKLALLHAPFRGTTLFEGELAKLQEANTKRAATFTVFPQPTAPPASYSTRPYAGRGKSFRDDKKGFRKPGGRGRGQGRSTVTATVTRPGQSKDSQKALTVSVSTDSKKRKSESQEDAPQGPRKAKRNFRGNKSPLCSNVFLVRKASGGWRPVIDLKNLNAHIHDPHFRMFTTSSVLSSVEKGHYAFKIDLQDAYFHVPIHPSSRKYFRFAFENRVYQFQVLPFGLNTAPQVFTRLGHTVTAYLHCQGISVIPYLDEWLVHHPDRQILLRHQALLLDTLDLVGFILNRKKFELDLTQYSISSSSEFTCVWT